MTAIVSFLLSFIVTGLIGSFIFGTIWSGVSVIFNTLMDAQFASFDGLNSFIRILSGMNEGNEFTVLLQKLSMVILLIVLMISIIKSMVYPITGKESTSPMTILMKAAVAAIFIAFYPTIVDFIIDLLNTFASSPLFRVIEGV